ncbi:hypothetical protein PG994_011732 [Apiospora phragmitis]|uniref:Cell division protein n=1 Tax=Apiospora phragmitis TaxID=2905665 RepID=A0ABR1TTZ9_9PEZI
MEGAVYRASSRFLKGTMGMRSLPLRAIHPVHPRFVRNIGSAPTIAQPSFWKSLVPKPFRCRKEPTVDWGVPKKPKSKEWNPATFFIIMFLFVGSMSIQMIALRRDFNTFTRRAETRIGVLREVIEKLQRGEEIDVEKALGTGDAEREKEWEEVLKELEKDEVARNLKKSEKPRQSNPKSTCRSETPAPPDTATVKTGNKPPSYSSFF